MASENAHHVTEKESLRVAEAARETEWEQPSFMRELFLGNFRLDLIHPYPLPAQDRAEFTAFYGKLEAFLRDEVDPAEIDRSGEYPQHVIDGLRELGAFGMKIPKEYGGLGFSHVEYGRVMELLGSADGNVAALLSAHQSIGVPQPLKLFGTEEQKQKYLPRCARGRDLGLRAHRARRRLRPGAPLDDRGELSPTARLRPQRREALVHQRHARQAAGGDGARPAKRKKISAFVVETDWPGVKVEHRCHFMGLRALANGVITFKDVRVPRENLIGERGQGPEDRAHHAQRRPPLDPQRLGRHRQALPRDRAAAGPASACSGASRSASTRRSRTRSPTWRPPRSRWSRSPASRPRWPTAAATTSASRPRPPRSGTPCARLGDRRRDDADPRRPRLRDRAVARGARRGADSGRAHDARLPHQPDLRGLERDHAPVHGARGGRQAPAGRRRDDRPREAARRRSSRRCRRSRASTPAGTRRAGSAGAAGRATPGSARSRRTCASSSAHRGSSRAPVFHGMVVYQAQAGAQAGVPVPPGRHRQRAVRDVGERVPRAHARATGARPRRARPGELADLFCRQARRRVRDLFRELWSNDDVARYRLGVSVLDGGHAWLEAGILRHEAPAARPAPRKQEVAVEA